MNREARSIFRLITTAPGRPTYRYIAMTSITIPAGEPIFLDTNVLVYANVATAPLHDDAVSAIQQLWDEGRAIWVSRQVLREYAAILTRPQLFSAPQSVKVVADRVRFFAEHFEVADSNADVTSTLLRLLEELDVKGKQVHDANVVATMLVQGVDYLLTHNTSDFARYSHLIQVIPLTAYLTE